MDDSKLYPLFVYGSLKTGSEEHSQMKGAKLVKHIQTAPYYKIVEKGGYVRMLDNGTESVPGELYMVSKDKLKALDKWEYGTFHEEVIKLIDGIKALAYIFHNQ